MFDKGDTLLLEDNKEYVVVDKFEENNNTYVYLIDIDDVSNFKFSKLDGNTISSISDSEELEKAIMIFNKRLHNNENNA